MKNFNLLNVTKLFHPRKKTKDTLLVLKCMLFFGASTYGIICFLFGPICYSSSCGQYWWELCGLVELICWLSEGLRAWGPM